MTKKELRLEQAHGFFELLLADKKMRIHLEARYGSHAVPGAKGLRAVEIGLCRQNQAFLRRVIEDAELIGEAIDASEKQGDILAGGQEEKEERLREKLTGKEAS